MAGSGCTIVRTEALLREAAPDLSIPLVHLVKMEMILCATSGNMPARSGLAHSGMMAARTASYKVADTSAMQCAP